MQYKDKLTVKVAERGNKKCRGCLNNIKKGHKYIEIPFEYIYYGHTKDGGWTGSLSKSLFSAFSIIPKKIDIDKIQIKRKTKYKRFCDDCLYTMFEKGLREGYENWIVKKGVESL